MTKSLFQQHFATSFDMGWHKSLPAFTAEDWRDFFLLVGTVWRLEDAPTHAGTPVYMNRYNSIQERFWDKAAAGSHIDRVHGVLVNLFSPFGGTPRTSVEMCQIFASWYLAKKDPQIHAAFREGLHKAVEADPYDTRMLRDIPRLVSGSPVENRPYLLKLQ